MTWERARNPEQKAIRRDEILDAARNMFRDLDYSEISLNGIARTAGFSKPNVYRYFSTKEEIFLTLFIEEQQTFIENMTRRVSKMRSKDAPMRIAEIWVDEAKAHRTLLQLLPEVMTSLEKNSSIEQIAEFKRHIETLMQGYIASLVDAYPALDEVSWTQVTQCIFALMAGLWPFCNPSENVLAATELAGVESPDWEFDFLMKQGIVSLIRGAEPNQRTGKR